MTVAAFQGEHGAYSEEACRHYFGEGVTTQPCRSFDDIFALVESGQAGYGVVPVENSTAGSINKSYDLLLDHDLKVHGEVLLRVRHNLLTVPGNQEPGRARITQVRSHPQALAQCETYLNRRKLAAVPWYDTAGSAKDLAADPVEGVAVIASRLAAEVYGLAIIDEGIEDLPNNYTRFFVVGRGDPPLGERTKTSLVFAVPNTPGSLYQALGEFATRQVNLTKLESRPRRNRTWQYVFYVDLDGHWQDANVSAAIVGLLNRAVFVKLLGSYPAARSLEHEATAGQAALLQI